MTLNPTTERLNKVYYELLSRRLIFSQADLARQIGKSRSTTNQMLSGAATIPYKTIDTLCSVFPIINKNWLLTGEGNMTNEAAAAGVNISNVGNPVVNVTAGDAVPDSAARIAALEAENESLKEQINWLRSMIK